MSNTKNHLSNPLLKKEGKIGVVFEISLFIIILLFSIKPVENLDFFFHLKTGEFITKTHTIPFKDYFSNSAYGKPANPYEWLFQIAIYFIYKNLGNFGVQTTVVTSVFIYIYFFRKILKEVFSLNLVSRILLLAIAFYPTYNYWVERPQALAYSFFMIVLYLVLKRVFNNINKLVFALPIFWLWVNLHASIVLGLFLFFSFSFVFFLNFLKFKNKVDLITARDFLGFGILSFAVTLLTPIGTKPYELLILFFQKRELITNVILEWYPLYVVLVLFVPYLIIMFGVVLSFIFLNLKFKIPNLKLILLYSPIFVLSLFVITGVRHIPFTMPLIVILYVPFIKSLKINIDKKITYGLIILFFIFYFFALLFFRKISTGQSRSLPTNAISFINSKLKGNIFNEYSIGGYLMYKLDDAHKVFIDGRTDMYLDDVLPDYYGIQRFSDNQGSDQEFYNYFESLTEKYHISYVLMTTKRFTFWQRLGRILGTHSNWHLVFFDDTDMIYSKDDSKNTGAINKFGVKFITPFGDKLYQSGKHNQAKIEYQKMFVQAPSAISANAIGYLLLEEKNYAEAKTYFLKALQINPNYAPSKMNLAELDVKDGNLNEAVSLYREAIKDEFEQKRGFAYLRLGELIIISGGTKEDAIKIWQEGLSKTLNKDVINKLHELIAS